MKTSSIIEMNKADDYDKTNLKAYQRLIGKLMYLLFSTRPDITYAIGQLSKRNANPTIGYFRVAKRVV